MEEERLKLKSFTVSGYRDTVPSIINRSIQDLFGAVHAPYTEGVRRGFEEDLRALLGRYVNDANLLDFEVSCANESSLTIVPRDRDTAELFKLIGI